MSCSGVRGQGKEGTDDRKVYVGDLVAPAEHGQ